MSYFVRHPHGATERDFPKSRFRDLLAELATSDTEHGDVSVTHESDWCLIVNRNLVIIENLEDGDPRHRTRGDERETLRLMDAIADGRIASTLAEDWQPGYGP